MARWVSCALVPFLPAACSYPPLLPVGPAADALTEAGPVCYGTAPFSVCFATAPTGRIEVAMPTTFDTASGTMSGTQLSCTTPTSGDLGYCVLAADTITIGAALRATGPKPLVLVAAAAVGNVGTPAADRRDRGMRSSRAGAHAATGWQRTAAIGHQRMRLVRSYIDMR